MAKAELFFLALLSLSFALIDPPVQEVYEHNVALAQQSVLPINVLNEPERTPDLYNPTTFFYVKILTLTPSVNESVTSKLHPELVWLAAENHVRSITQRGGKTEYDKPVSYEFPELQTSWVAEPGDHGLTVGGLPGEDGSISYYGTDVMLTPETSWAPGGISVIAEEPEEEDECVTTIRRTYDDLEIQSITAHYTLTGILNKEDGKYVYGTAERTVLIADNETTPQNPSPVPFRENPICAAMAWFGEYLLGGFINLDCNDEALTHASPYATGVNNLTVRNLTVVDPRLDVRLDAHFTIYYEQERKDCWWEEDDCKCDPPDHSNGTIPLTGSDFASYEVQNDYMSIVPYSPAFLNLNANTSEDVIYYFSLLANSELYKYYSKMDGNVSSAYYIYDFSVVNDSYGTQFIVANEINHSGLLPYDPQAANNYTGARRLLINEHGVQLRSPTEVTNRSYNYSRIYNFQEIFYNLTPGEHHADLMFYTWWGEYSESSDIYARNSTTLSVTSYAESDDVIVAVCKLTRKGDAAVPAVPVEIKFDNQTQRVFTDTNGICQAVFKTDKTVGTIEAAFSGNDVLLPSDAMHIATTDKPFSFGDGFVIDNFFLLLLLALLVGFAFLNIGSNTAIAGMTMGAALGKFSFTGKGGPPIRMYRVKKGKELVVSVIGALAGGAGAAMASKIAAQQAAKKAAQQAAKKAGTAAAKKKAAAAAKKKAKENAKKKAYDKKKKRAMMEEKKYKRKADFDAAWKQRYTPEEIKKIEKRLDEIRKGRLNMKRSQMRLPPEFVHEVQQDAKRIIEEKIEFIKKRLPGDADAAIREDTIKKLRKVKVYVVEQKTWRAEIPNYGGGLNTYGMRLQNPDEIFISQNRASDKITRIKTLDHEVDHLTCKYKEKILFEGHADWSAKNKLGNDFNPSLAAYRYQAASYEMLAELGGESYLNNHSAYAGGAEELKEKIVEKYKGKMKAEEIRTRFDSILKQGEEQINAYVKTGDLYKELEPVKYDKKIQTLETEYGVKKMEKLKGEGGV